MLSWNDFSVGTVVPVQPAVDPNQAIYDLIDRVSGEYGVDPKLIRSMIDQESKFNPKAVSPKGAKGLMQLMPGTAEEMGVKDPFNPEENIRGGVGYYKKMLDAQGGDQARALAAYNFGPGNVAKGLEWPKETRDYIAAVTGSGGGDAMLHNVTKQPSLGWEDFTPMKPEGGVDLLGKAKTFGGMVKDSLVENTHPVVPTGKLPLGIPAHPNELVQSGLDVAYGIPEAVAALGSGMASFPAGQVGGLAALPRDEKSLAKAFDIAEGVNQAGMYKPVTNTGQLLLKPIETAFGAFLGTVDKVARASAPEGATEEELVDRSKAWQYVANTALLGAPLAVKGSRVAARKVMKGKAQVTPEVLESAKAKVMADPSVPPTVKQHVASTPLDKIAEQINKGQASARVDKTGGPQVKFEGNGDIVKGLLVEAELREGRGKVAMRKAAKIVAEHDGDISTADLKGIKGIDPKGSTGKAIARLIAEREEAKKMAEGTGEVPEFEAPPAAKVEPIVKEEIKTPDYSESIIDEGMLDFAEQAQDAQAMADAQKRRVDFERLKTESAKPDPIKIVAEVDPSIEKVILDKVGVSSIDALKENLRAKFSRMKASENGVREFLDALDEMIQKGDVDQAVQFYNGAMKSKETIVDPEIVFVNGVAKFAENPPGSDPARIAREVDPQIEAHPEQSLGLNWWTDKETTSTFATKTLDPVEVKAKLEEIRNGYKPKATESEVVPDVVDPVKSEESIISEFDNIGFAKEEGYTFPSKRTYSTPEEASTVAALKGEGYEVVKVGEKWRVGKYVEEAPRGEYVPEVGDSGEARRVFELAREEEKRKAAEGSEVDELYSDGVTAEDWKVLEEITKGVNLDEVRLEGEVVAEVKAVKESIPPEAPKPRIVDSASAAQKFLEWRDSYVTKCNIEDTIPVKGKKKIKTPITKEVLPLVDDKFAIFDKLEDAEAFRDAKGSSQEIVRDPATGKYFLEPKLDLLDKGDMWDLGDKEYLSETYSREGGLGEDVLDYGESGGRGRDLWDIMNNERGSVDVTPLYGAVETIENIVKMAKKVGKTVDEYLDSMGVDQASIDLFKASLANLGQMKQELRDKDSLGMKILDPIGPIVHQTILKDKNGKVVWTRPPVTKELAEGVVGMDRRSNWGTDVARTDPKTGRVTVEHTTNILDRFMTATETKVNAFRGPIRDLYRTWRDAKANAKVEKAEVKVWLDGLKSQIAPERRRDFAIACYADMKSVREAYEKMGITDIPTLSPTEMMVKEQLLDYTRKFRQRSNLIRTRTGQKAIPKLLDMNGQENYLPLFRDLNVLRELGLGEGMINSTNAKLGQLSKTFNGMFNPHSKKRNVSDIPIELDPFKAIEKYSGYGLDEIHVSPVAALAKELAYVKLPHPSGKGKVTLREWNPALSLMLSKWSDSIVGKDSTATAMANTNPLIHKGLESLSKNLVLATIGGSLRTIFVQPSSYVIAVPTLLDTRSTLYGLGRLVADRAFGREASLAKKKSSVLAIREFDLAYSEWTDYVQRGLATGLKDWVGDKSMAPMKWVDGVVAEASWNAGYHYGKERLKLGGDDLIHFADDVVEKTQGMGIKGGVSDIQTGKVTKWLTLLQTFGIADFNFIIRDVLGIKNADVGNKQALMRASKYIVATVLAGQLYKMMGYENVVPDPIGEYLKVKKDGGNVHAVASAAGELLEKVPMIGGSAKYGSSLGGVVGEWASLVPEAAMKFSESLDWDTLTPREKRKNIQLIAKAIGYTYGVPMTNQIMKSINTAYNGGNPYEVIMGVYKEAPKGGSGRGRRRGRSSSR